MRSVQNLLSKCIIPWRQFKPVNSVRWNSKHLFNNNEEYQPLQAEKCINEVFLMGRVGKDPAVLEKNGKPFLEFPLVISTKFMLEGFPEEKKHWYYIFTHNVHLIKSIENAVKKGDRLHIYGKLGLARCPQTKRSKTGVIVLRYISFS